MSVGAGYTGSERAACVLLGLFHLTHIHTLRLRERERERESRGGGGEAGSCYLALEVINESSKMLDQEGPRVDEEDPIHHHNDQTIPENQAR